MTITGWSLVRFAHVLAAMGWVGGQITLAAIVFPVMRADMAPELRVPVIRKAARRFGLAANVVLLPGLLITGLAMASRRDLLTWDTFTDPGYRRLFTIKMVFVAVSVILASVHGVLATRRPRSARPLAISSLASATAIVVFATALVP